MHRDQTEEDGEVRAMELSQGSARLGAVSWRAGEAEISGELWPRARSCLFKLAAFAKLPIGQAGLGQMSCQAEVGASMGGCVRAAARGWEGGKKSMAKKEWWGSRQKNPRPCVSKAQLIHC